MADSKISALPASTTPLAGTETLPIVQSGVTKQVSVANLTVDRSVGSAGGTFTDNHVQGTAAKGINFTANTPAAGMTSQLLNAYESGTWTPAITAGISGVGYASRSGTYTRIGNIVTISGQISTNAGTATSDQIVITGLPFPVASTGGAFFTYLNTGVAASLWIASGSMYGYKATGANLNGTDLASASNTIVYFTGQYTTS